MAREKAPTTSREATAVHYLGAMGMYRLHKQELAASAKRRDVIGVAAHALPTATFAVGAAWYAMAVGRAVNNYPGRIAVSDEATQEYGGPVAAMAHALLGADSPAAQTTVAEAPGTPAPTDSPGR